MQTVSENELGVDAKAVDTLRSATNAIRTWLLEARTLVEAGQAFSAEEISQLENVLAASQGREATGTRASKLAAAILAADVLWCPESTANLPVDGLEALAGRAEGPSGEALMILLEFLQNSDSAQSAVWLTHLVISGALDLPPRIVGIMLNALAKEPDELQDLADDLYQQGNKDVAAELCRHIIANGQAFPATYRILALSEAESAGDPEDYLQLGLLHFPNDQYLLIELAKAQRARGDLDAAATHALRASRHAASDLDILAESLGILTAAKRFNSVFEFNVGSLPDDPKFLSLLVEAASAAFHSGQYSAALRFSRDAFALDAENPTVRNIILELGARLWNHLDAKRLAMEVFGAQDPAEWRVFVHARLELLDSLSAEARRDAIGEFANWALAEAASIERDLRLRLIALAAGAGLADVTESLVRHATKEGRIGMQPCMAIAKAAGIIPHSLISKSWTAETLADWLQDAAEHPPAGRKLHVPVALRLLAAALNPSSIAARLNAGLAELAIGNAGEAECHFGAIRRRERFSPGRVAWPLVGPQGVWPKAPFEGLESFFAEKLDGVAWPRITLVTPSLNQGRFIEESILSVLNQNYPNLEYLIIDGGSTDETGVILERYRDRISRIVVRDGMTQTEALNHGFSQASGEILGWLNTDDILLPGALHAFGAAFVQSGADVLIGDCLILRDGAVEGLVAADRGADRLQETRLLDIYRSWLTKGFICQPETMVSRAAFDRIGGQLDETLHYTMDYDMWLRLAKDGASMLRVSWPIAGFRKHPEQKTAREFACFTELRKVRDRYARDTNQETVSLPTVLAHAKQECSQIELCVWDAAGCSPLGRMAVAGSELAIADGRKMRFVRPNALEPGSGLKIHLIGLGSELPNPDRVGESPRSAGSPLVTWIWNTAEQFVEKRKISELSDVAIATDSEAGNYLANRLERCPALPQAATTLAAHDWARDLGSIEREHTSRCGFVIGSGIPSEWPYDASIKTLDRDGLPIELVWMEDLAAASGGDEGTYLDLLSCYDVLLVPSITGEIPSIAYEAMLAGALPVVLVSASIVKMGGATLEPEVERVQLHHPGDLARVAKESLDRFQRGGKTQVVKRREAVLSKHMLTHRIEQLLSILKLETGS